MSTRHDRAAHKLANPYPGIPTQAFKRAWRLCPRKRRRGLLNAWLHVLDGSSRFSPASVAAYLRLGHRYQAARDTLAAAAPKPRA